MRKKRILVIVIASLLFVALIVGGVSWWLEQAKSRRSDFSVAFGSWSEGIIDVASSCAGLGLSPEIKITSAPATARSYGLLLQDTSNEAVHWLVWDIPTTQTAIRQGARPEGTIARSYDGNFKYAPICPDFNETRTYKLTVFAFEEESLRQGSGTDPAQAIRAMYAKAYGYTSAEASFERVRPAN